MTRVGQVSKISDVKVLLDVFLNKDLPKEVDPSEEDQTSSLRNLGTLEQAEWSRRAYRRHRRRRGGRGGSLSNLLPESDKMLSRTNNQEAKLIVVCIYNCTTK